MQINVFRKDVIGREFPIKYWCNAEGELCNPHFPGFPSISADELPDEDFRNAWEKLCGDGVYIVETPHGAGVAVLYQFDRYFVDEYSLTHDELLSAAITAASKIALLPELTWITSIYIQEGGVKSTLDVNDAHELIVVFPINIDQQNFNEAWKAIEEHVYKYMYRLHEGKLNACPVCKNSSVLMERLHSKSESSSPYTYTYVCSNCGLRTSIQAESVAAADFIWNEKIANPE